MEKQPLREVPRDSHNTLRCCVKPPKGFYEDEPEAVSEGNPEAEKPRGLASRGISRGPAGPEGNPEGGQPPRFFKPRVCPRIQTRVRLSKIPRETSHNTSRYCVSPEGPTLGVVFPHNPRSFSAVAQTSENKKSRRKMKFIL